MNLVSGALDRNRFPGTADGLRSLIYMADFTPINIQFKGGRKFPVFKTSPFSLMEDFGFIINIWVVRDEIENFHVIGGVAAQADKSVGYKSAYRMVLDKILSSDENSEKAIAVIDHVITDYLQKLA